MVAKDSDAGLQLLPQFEELWSPYLEHMQDFVRIDIESCELITSPGYDLGFSRDELVRVNFEKISELAG